MNSNRSISVLSVIITVYNEKHRIGPTIGKIKNVHLPGIQKEIIIVDDGSADGTKELLHRFLKNETKLIFEDPVSNVKYSPKNDNCHLISLQENHGKGYACRKGFDHASGDVIIIQDADLEFDPKNYSHLLEPLQSGTADAVIGSRFLNQTFKPDFLFSSTINYVVNTLFNLLNGSNLSDVTSGHKLLMASALESLTFEEDAFGIDLEIPAKLLKRDFKIEEIPIKNYTRRS